MSYDRLLLLREALRELESAPSISMSQLAARLQISRTTLGRVLRAAGTSFRRLRVSARLTCIERLLGTGSISVKEAAYLAGFSSPSALAHFLRSCGLASATALRLMRSSGVHPSGGLNFPPSLQDR